MGFFSDLGDFISKPVRGVGRILRGNVREGLRDIGSTVKTAAPALAFIPGIGAPAALGIGALAGGLGSKRGASFGDVAGGALGGAASAGLGSAAKGLTSGLSVAGPGLAGGAEAAGAGAPAVSGIGKLAGIAKTAAPIIRDVAPAAAQAYGAYQMGKAEDRAADLDEEALQRRWEDEERRRRTIDEILERGRASGRFN